MVIENQQEVQTITLNGVDYSLNLREIETFMQQCDLFMELRAQLKFLREVSFLLRCMLSPAGSSSKY
jgi:hypothetical protein